MADGKMQILAWLMKYGDRTFRARNVVEGTGLSRQLVHNHLVKFVESGLLQKEENFYIVLDKETLVDAMVSSADSSRRDSNRSYPTVLFGEVSTRKMQQCSKEITQAVAMGLPDSKELKNAYLQDLDNTIRSLKAERAWVAGKQYGAALTLVARSVENNPDFVDNLLSYATAFEIPFYDKHKYEGEVNNTVEEIKARNVE